MRVAGGLVAGDALAVNGRAEPAGRERGEHLPAGHLPPRQSLPAEGTGRVGASDAHDLQVLPEPMIPGPRPARGLAVDRGRNLVLDPALARTGLRRADQGQGARAWMGTSRNQLSSRALAQAQHASAPGPPSRYRPIKASIQLPD